MDIIGLYKDELAPHLSEEFGNNILELLKKNSDLDGDFATSDLIRACKKMGKRVPEDISIVGFDDTWISTLTYPSITTIHQPVQEMCEYAIEAIVKKVKGEKVPSQVVFPVDLIDRESTK